jgi:hypothetical protein
MPSPQALPKKASIVMTSPTIFRQHVVEIGEIPIALRTSDQEFYQTLSERYAGFLSSAEPVFEIELDLTSIPSLPEELRVSHENGEWLLERSDFRARCNLRTRRAVVQQGPNSYSIDTVLRILHSFFLASRHGFLLHAASGVCDGRAFLFSGVSGAGKTTLARLAPPDVALLSDEISYVRRHGDGYAAFGTPFFGELAKAGENCAAPVSALFLLEKGPENRIIDLPPAEAMHRLMRNILFFADDHDLVDKILATACDFVSRVPVQLLVFYPDSKVWDSIRQFEGGALHV